jgi:hypothetical protein
MGLPSTEPAEPGQPMKRRHFICAATASVLFPTAPWAHIAAPKTLSQKWDYVFFDERFEDSRRIAAAVSGPTRLIGVQGDITAWRDELERVTREHPMRLSGATTHSFLFCLRILVGEHADLDLQVFRLDRNLYRWTMSTSPKAQYGTTPWPSHYHLA